MDGLLLIYYKIIFFSGCWSGFRIFSGFSINLQISSQNEWFTYLICNDDFLLRKFIRFPDFFRDFTGFSLNLQIYSQNWWYTSHIWYEDFFSGNVSDFRIFSRIFPDFHHIFRFILYFYSLLCSRSRTLSLFKSC